MSNMFAPDLPPFVKNMILYAFAGIVSGLLYIYKIESIKKYLVNAKANNSGGTTSTSSNSTTSTK